MHPRRLLVDVANARSWPPSGESGNGRERIVHIRNALLTSARLRVRSGDGSGRVHPSRENPYRLSAGAAVAMPDKQPAVSPVLRSSGCHRSGACTARNHRVLRDTSASRRSARVAPIATFPSPSPVAGLLSQGSSHGIPPFGIPRRHPRTGTATRPGSAVCPRATYNPPHPDLRQQGYRLTIALG